MLPIVQGFICAVLLCMLVAQCDMASSLERIDHFYIEKGNQP